MKLVKFSLIPPIVAISALFASLCACGATQRYVSKDGSYGADVAGAECYTTLQKAVAACVNGDTVWVKDGFECTPADGYSDDQTTKVLIGKSTIQVNANITLRGETGNWQTGPIVRGSKTDSIRCIGVPFNNASGSKFTLIGFRLEDGATDANGGGVYMDPRNGLVTNCCVVGCSGKYGGGIYCKGSSEIVCCCVISNCTASGYGSSVVNGSSATLFDNLHFGCKTMAPIMATGNGSMTITGDQFVSNSVGAITATLNKNAVKVNGCTFRGNGGNGNFGCVYGWADVKDSLFEGNSGYKGGAVSSYDKDSLDAEKMVCTRCTFRDNQTSGNSGYGSVGFYVRFIDCVIDGNSGKGTPPLYGGSAYNTLIVRNTTTSGPCVIKTMQSPDKTPVATASEFVNCTAVGNTTKNGAAVAVDEGGTLALVNTIVSGNTTTADDSYTSATTCFFDSDGDPKLVKAGKEYAFWPKPKSPCVGTGTVLEWMSDETDARSKDLAGLPRLTDGKVNIGCYEGIAPMPGLLLLLR